MSLVMLCFPLFLPRGNKAATGPTSGKSAQISSSTPMTASVVSNSSLPLIIIEPNVILPAHAGLYMSGEPGTRNAAPSACGIVPLPVATAEADGSAVRVVVGCADCCPSRQPKTRSDPTNMNDTGPDRNSLLPAHVGRASTCYGTDALRNTLLSSLSGGIQESTADYVEQSDI